MLFYIWKYGAENFAEVLEGRYLYFCVAIGQKPTYSVSELDLFQVLAHVLGIRAQQVEQLLRALKSQAPFMHLSS